MNKYILSIAVWLVALGLSAQSQSFSIGSTYQGGVIFYVEPGGAWGLAAAPNDLPDTYWPQAKQACKDLILGKKADWYLPSIEELRLLYDQRSLVGNFNSNSGDYWSATEVTLFGLPNYATAKKFSTGLESTKAKTLESIGVRPIRRFYIPLTHAGIEAACLPASSSTAGVVPGPARLTYGSGINMKNSTRRTNLTIGNMVVGLSQGDAFSTGFGNMSDLYLAPAAPLVTASQGELLDRIQVSWTPSPLGALPTEGYKLFRDGIFLGSFDNNVRNFNDFNVIAGTPYVYSVVGVNNYGDGTPGEALGFQVPNGVVTGYVQTLNASPVADAVVTLTPMQGFSALFGNSDLAFAEDSLGFLHNAGNWTLSFWVQTDNAAAGSKLFSFAGASWSLAPLASAGGHEGVVLNVTGQTPLTAQFPDSTKTGWHHIAVTHDGAMFRLYRDGVLEGSITAAATSGNTQTLNISGSGSMWHGRLDELRIYHKRLDELDFGEIMESTASSLTPGLKYYWKMDEELGTKSFDVIGRNRLFFCGPAFDASRPAVRTAGKTDSDGYYRIESANYGTGTTFIAEPMKLFYMHRALKFARAEQDYATLPNFGLTDTSTLQTATLELWVNSAGPDGTQCLLSKKWGANEFRLSLVPSGNNNDLRFYLNGTEKSFGTLGIGYRHLAFTLQQQGSTLTVKGYNNNAAVVTQTFTAPTGNWSDTTQTWLVGARPNGASRTDYFGGLIDEIAVYDTLLSIASITAHRTTARDPQERHLHAYFAFDEGAGNRLYNTGAKLTGAGQSSGTEWSAFCAIQQTEPHVFSPVTRQVTLNPSVTSVDQVDFTDRSTVPVTGYVRYVNTDCFARNIEILVNGTSWNPAVYTDSTGRFVVELDPGATVTLSPKFEDHTFTPASWDIVNISSPVAGLVFNDMTTRSVQGVVAGGKCKLPIINNGEICKVKIRTKNGCYERELTITDPGGEFEFNGLPPAEMTVAVTEFSNPVVFDAFQVQGGSTVDLAEQDTVLNFLYYAPPEIIINSGIDPVSPTCSTIVMEQGDLVEMNINVVEKYGTEYCYLDTADFKILNGISGEAKDTAMGGNENNLVYKFRVGNPNPVPPHLQTLQLIATTLNGNEVSTTVQVVVTGLRSKENIFTTVMPETPSLILRDPPGDGSYAYWEKGQKICNTTTMSLDNSTTNDAGLQLYLGPDFELSFTFLGVGETTPVETIFDFGFSGSGTIQTINDTTFQTCIAFNEKISTSSDELVVGGGQGGDVYIGGGMNLIFGFADLVSFNAAACTPAVQSVLNVQPDGFKTTFAYSEWDIRRNIMRYLDSLALDPNATQIQKDGYLASKANWQKMLDDNAAQKAAAKVKRNISFGAGVEYEYSETSDTTYVTSIDTVKTNSSTVSFDIGFLFGGLGLSASVSTTKSKSTGEGIENGIEKGITTGYVLTDNDPGDLFSVDVAMDDVYKTPVFITRTGQSVCPWELGTAHREGCLLSLRDGSGAVATDVPANEPAVFKFTLGNTSATNELRTYAFTSGPESNPDGAVIKLNGAVLDHPVLYAIPYGESIPITLTLERGPEKYDYDDLEVVLYSECEDTRAGQIGLVPDEDTILYSAIYISAHFIKPCSEVEITVPQQDWVVHPDNNPATNDNILKITLSGYDKDDTDLDVIRVQYRPVGGDGAWINIGDDIPKVSLGALFSFHDWNTAGLVDGPYEIRAMAVCSGDASDKPGFSHIIKGRIERQPPQIIGVPEPADGVFNTGDEISVTFNKDLDCSKIFKADLLNERNIGLYDANTNALIDFNLYCFENKIELVPTFQNQYFENKVLRLELDSIPDKIGNRLVAAEWEFYVDRNELAWLTDSVGMTKHEDETKTVTASIHNRGGSPMPFTITGAPDWVRVVPNSGTLVPNEIRPISFEVDSTLAFGHWADTIVLHTEIGQNPFFMGGDEALPFGVRVVCRPPDWELDAGLYPVTMNMVLKLDIQGEISLDVEDIVAAYIDGELRGRAHVMYVPQVNQYLAYLTIYGESAEAGANVELQVWDASACLRYGAVQETFTFQPDNVVGTPVAPQTVHTNSLVLREIPLANGWNWISFNLAFPDPALDAALVSLKHPANDLIKSQSAFSMYSSGWFGSLATLGNTSMYQFRADQPDTIRMLGNLIDPSSVNIPLVSGWNWLGYLPNAALPLNVALASLNPADGDLVKSQTAFAQYIAGFGWIGNLKFMQPPQGYQLRLSGSGTLTYPSGNAKPEDMTEDRGPATAAYWQVDPTQYEHNMTLIGMLVQGDQNTTPANTELGAFVGDDLRGAAQAVWVEPAGAYLYFLTTYANTAGELLHFKMYNPANGAVAPLAETMYFASDLHQGTIDEPVPFTLQSTGWSDPAAVQRFDLQPNPFSESTMLLFETAVDQELKVVVTDVSGRLLEQFRWQVRQGRNARTWRPEGDLPSGIYYVKIESAAGTEVRKVIRG